MMIEIDKKGKDCKKVMDGKGCKNCKYNVLDWRCVNEKRTLIR